jgi:GMP synthase (glutamine-hydrolysing)
MKVLVLQAREATDPMLGHEQRCFERATGLGPGELVFRNLADAVPERVAVAAHDAVMVGGSGRFSVAHPTEAFHAATADLLRWIVDARIPTFASCFGFQLLVDALGGRVEHDPDRGEVGSFWLELTDEGARDPLLGRLPQRFVAQMGHLDRATVMPPGVPNLASSERAPLQALRVPDAPVWATQFHPELDQQGNHDRYVAYLDRYGGGERDADYRSLPSPEASGLLRAFLELVAAGGS